MSLWTLGVGGAGLGLLDTADHWCRVGDEARGTGALGPMVHHLAVGIWSAGVSKARVRATVVDASVRFWTVTVGPTAHNTHLVETNMAKEAVVVHTTCH